MSQSHSFTEITVFMFHKKNTYTIFQNEKTLPARAGFEEKIEYVKFERFGGKRRVALAPQHRLPRWRRFFDGSHESTTEFTFYDLTLHTYAVIKCKDFTSSGVGDVTRDWYVFPFSWALLGPSTQGGTPTFKCEALELGWRKTRKNKKKRGRREFSFIYK